MQVLAALAGVVLSTAAHFSPLYVYDEAVVPKDARVWAVPVELGQSTTVLLLATGLRPGRPYGAHVHQDPCGLQPQDAGPHTQDVPDPVQPSVDPAYANPRNEVWLDFTTDAAGNGLSLTTVPWKLSAKKASSVVLHAEKTQAGAGHAGMAGARAACIGLPERPRDK